MIKSIPFEVFGSNQFLYFDIKRLMRLEQLLGKSVSNIVATHDISLNFIVNAVMVGLSHHSKESAAQWSVKVEHFFDDGGSIEELAVPIIQAVIASGIFGRIENETEGSDSKNAQKAAESTE